MSTLAMKTFIQGLPKAELHLHIEGSLEPELMFTLADRNGLTLGFDSIEALKKAYAFSNLQSFLDIYYEGARVLTRTKDFFDLAWAYLKKAHGQNVRHAEIFFDPQTHTSRGVAFKTILNGLERAITRGRETFGLSAQLIMCFLRHRSPEDAMKTLEQALPYRDRIKAVGLDSSEAGYPPQLFAMVFERARRAGFLAVAHAGEEGPPDYIRQALDLLRVARIDHGVRCLEDSDLTADLARRQVPLTVCPLSNVKLRVFATLAQHNIKELFDRGLCVTINSDDPAYFGGYINENFLAVTETFDLSIHDLYRLAKNSFDASFADEPLKRQYIKELNQYVASYS
jgi:adenosine deaminase